MTRELSDSDVFEHFLQTEGERHQHVAQCALQSLDGDQAALVIYAMCCSGDQQETRDAARDLLIAKVADGHREHAEAKAEAEEMHARDCRNDKESGWWQ